MTASGLASASSATAFGSIAVSRPVTLESARVWQLAPDLADLRNLCIIRVKAIIDGDGRAARPGVRLVAVGAAAKPVAA